MMNPVLRREAITSLRGWKNYAVLTFYLAVMALGAWIFLYGSMFGSYDYRFDPQNMVVLYVILSAIQMGLVVLSVPALAAGSISGERERQTLDLLLVTKMSPLSIVIGKLLSSMAFILLLIVGTLPVFALVFYFGAVQISSLLVMILFTMTTAFMLGGISVFFSCVYKRTVVSIMLVYIIMGFLCVGTLIWVLVPLMLGRGAEEPSLWAIVLKLIPNPGVGFFSLVDNQLGMNVLTNAIPLWRFNQGVSPLLQWIIGHLWLVHMGFQLVVGSGFILMASKMLGSTKESKVKKSKKEKKKKKQETNKE